MKMSKRFLVTLLTLVVIATAALAAVFLAKGYTYVPKIGGVVGTGIISVTSLPNGASVYIDGHLTTATDTTVSSLVPKTYEVKIIKEGFIPWEKKVIVKEGLVSEVKATLFPAIPTIYPLTFNGVENPVLSPDGQRLAFAVPISTSSATAKQKGGLWVWTMSNTPIAFSRGGEPRQLITSTAELNFTKATLRWSPDSKQILVTLQEGGREGVVSQRNYLLSAEAKTDLSDLRDLTAVIVSTTKAWEEDQKTKDELRNITIKNPLAQKVASDSAMVVWSPDETKFFYRKEKLSQEQEKGEKNIDFVKVYDLLDQKEYNLPEAQTLRWLPDSRHIILVQGGKIGISEFDGSNVAIIYAGNFLDSFVFPWPDSSRLVILSSLPIPTALLPNLYGINLK